MRRKQCDLSLQLWVTDFASGCWYISLECQTRRHRNLWLLTQKKRRKGVSGKTYRIGQMFDVVCYSTGLFLWQLL
jgi:hypothetical protein